MKVVSKAAVMVVMMAVLWAVLMADHSALHEAGLRVAKSGILKVGKRVV